MELPLRSVSTVSAIGAVELAQVLFSAVGGVDWRVVGVGSVAALVGVSVGVFWTQKRAKRRFALERQATAESLVTQLRAMVESVPWACGMFDEQGQFTYANSAAQTLLGAGAEAYGRTLDASGQQAEVRARWNDFARRALRGDRVEEEFSSLRDGAPCLGLLAAVPLRTAGKVTGAIIFQLDRSDRLAAEHDRYQARRRLEQHLKQAPFAVIEWDLEGMVKAWNPVAESIFGYSELEVRGKSAVNLIIPEEQRAAYSEAWRTLLEQRSPLRIVLRSRTQSGRSVMCEWSSSLLHDEAGRITGVVSFAQEITDRLQMESRMQQSLHLESMGRLAAGVAHEFNNLLAPMVIEVERIANHAGEPLRVAEHVTALRRAITQARELTERAQLIGGRSVEGRDWLDLGELVTTVVHQLRGGLDHRIQILLSCDPALPRLSVSRTAVAQILTNLIFNARDAFPPLFTQPASSSWKATITVTTSRWEGVNPAQPTQGASPFQVITVRDNGPGLSRAAREHIFEPFFTTKSPGSGHGLGLALVWRLARNHEGWVTLQSEEGQGCELRVFLPERTGTPDTPTIGSAPKATAVGTSRRPGLLLVEDNLLVANALAGVLEDRGYRVFSADTAERAWELLESDSEGIDLALCDLNLPGMSGRQLLEKIQQTPRPIPFVMMSGYVAKSDSTDLNRLGAAALIAKPIDPHELLRIVTRIAPLPT